jgi:hypothetical protein
MSREASASARLALPVRSTSNTGCLATSPNCAPWDAGSPSNPPPKSIRQHTSKEAQLRKLGCAPSRCPTTSDILRSTNGAARHELVDKLVSQSLEAAKRLVPLAGNRNQQGMN